VLIGGAAGRGEDKERRGEEGQGELVFRSASMASILVINIEPLIRVERN
jgi:hypothetical protein